MSRSHRIDRSLRQPQWPIRIATIVIVLGGAAVLALAFARSEWRRERVVAGLEIGDPAQRVEELMGRPSLICMSGSLAHLVGQFTPDWPVAAQQRAVEQLEAETTERWIYPLSDGEPDCAAPTGTEIGYDADRRVYWYVAVIGRRPLQLPEEYRPAAESEQLEEPDA